MIKQLKTSNDRASSKKQLDHQKKIKKTKKKQKSIPNNLNNELKCQNYSAQSEKNHSIDPSYQMTIAREKVVQSKYIIEQMYSLMKKTSHPNSLKSPSKQAEHVGKNSNNISFGVEYGQAENKRDEFLRINNGDMINQDKNQLTEAHSIVDEEQAYDIVDLKVTQKDKRDRETKTDTNKNKPRNPNIELEEKSIEKSCKSKDGRYEITDEISGGDDDDEKIKSDHFKIKGERKDRKKALTPVSKEEGRTNRLKNRSSITNRVEISRETSNDSTDNISKTSASSSPLRRKMNDQPLFQAKPISGVKTSSEQSKALDQSEVSPKSKSLTKRSQLLLMSDKTRNKPHEEDLSRSRSRRNSKSPMSIAITRYNNHSDKACVNQFRHYQDKEKRLAEKSPKNEIRPENLSSKDLLEYHKILLGKAKASSNYVSVTQTKEGSYLRKLN